MAKATYHNENLAGKSFDILTKNKDGTLDIGSVGVVIVKSCPVSDAPKIGHAVIEEEVKLEEPKTKK